MSFQRNYRSDHSTHRKCACKSISIASCNLCSFFAWLSTRNELVSYKKIMKEPISIWFCILFLCSSCSAYMVYAGSNPAIVNPCLIRIRRGVLVKFNNKTWTDYAKIALYFKDVNVLSVQTWTVPTKKGYLHQWSHFKNLYHRRIFLRCIWRCCKHLGKVECVEYDLRKILQRIVEAPHSHWSHGKVVFW